MKDRALIRRAACVIAAICALGIFCLFLAGGAMSRPWLMLIPAAPFAMLAMVAVRTSSAGVAQIALALILVFGLLAAGRVFYTLLGYDHWLILPVLILGVWEIAIVSAMLIAWGLVTWVRPGARQRHSA